MDRRVSVMLLTILSYSGYVNCYNYLALFPHPGKSHFMVFKPILEELAIRNHSVTVLSFFPKYDSSPNYKDLSLEGIYTIMLSTVDLNLFDFDYGWYNRIILELQSMDPLAYYATSICEKIAGNAKIQQFFIQNTVKYDAIFVEGFNSDCLLGIAKHYIDAPVISISSTGFLQWTADRFGVPEYPAYIPTLGTAFTSDMGILDRLENAVVLYYYKIWYRYNIQIVEHAIIEKHFNTTITDLGLTRNNMDLLFTNTHYSFQGVRPLVAGVIEIGGVHIYNSETTLPTELERFLENSDDGVIVFSIGTLLKCSTMSDIKQKMFLNAFSRINQRVIWKCEDKNIENVGDNILISKWIPQHALFKHEKVIGYVGHGGLLGMTEAIDAGIPMIIIPFFGDQPSNAAMAESVGIAKQLYYGTITEELLVDALLNITSPKMQNRAKEFSAIWRDRAMSPMDTAIYWMERVARHGHNTTLIPPSRNMPFYKLYLLDVLLLIIFILSIIFISMYLILKLITTTLKRCIFKCASSKEKKN